LRSIARPEKEQEEAEEDQATEIYKVWIAGKSNNTSQIYAHQISSFSK
jgi:hypothetical protein